ncbi:MAG: leucyl aminopeptidase [Chlorobi bacterium]|nr:leucyl aminopeptidase [Chlorobiota bacterium]
MVPDIIHIKDRKEGTAELFLVKDVTVLSDLGFEKEEIEYVMAKNDEKNTFVQLPEIKHSRYVKTVIDEPVINKTKEELRKDGHSFFKAVTKDKKEEVTIFDLTGDSELVLAVTEGVVLASYTFDKYKTDKKEDDSVKLKSVYIASPVVQQSNCDELRKVCEAVFITRNMVNEPVNKLDVKQLSDRVRKLSDEYGFSAEIYSKSKIESLKMGGLLAVNRGSQDPPAFIIMEWKPANAKNDTPVVIVGKGVVFDTGGINLKTPPGSLDDMKADMGGAASVIGTMVALASNKVPYHVVGLVPATDNRPGFNAYVPGDIITMFNGKTVEVINTDAEGRMILADALSYADKYKPSLVIDLATLTGSAVMAIGQYGTVVMGTAEDEAFVELEKAGEEVHERLVRFPFWKDYDELIKSDVADIKNLGGREAGAITAGKFLSHFTLAPWIHMDIAGPAFLHKEDSYRGTGGTGVGVRLLYHFFKQKTNQ